MKGNILLGDLKKKEKNVDWLVDELSRIGVVTTKSTVYKKIRGASQFNAKEIRGIAKIMNYSNNDMISIFFEELVS